MATRHKTKKSTKTRNNPEANKDVRTKIIINAPKLSRGEALKKADEKLGKLSKKMNKKLGGDIENKSLEDFDDNMTLKELRGLEKRGIRVIYPNLKYAEPKYENVSELMKFVESDHPQEGGVKIIIMNFND